MSYIHGSPASASTANDYCVAADIKEAMTDAAWDTSYDTLLADLATHASREFDRLTHRDPGAYCVNVDSIRLYDGSGRREQWIDELAAAPTLVEVDMSGVGQYQTWPTTDYFCWPYNAPSKGMPYNRLDIPLFRSKQIEWWPWPQGVRITGKWGFAVVTPDDVAFAAVRMGLRFFKRCQQAYQDTGAIPELGQLRYTKAIDPEVDQVIKNMRVVTT